MSCWPALQPSHHSRLSGLLLASWAKNFYCKQLLQKQHWANRICSVFFQKRFLFEIFKIELASASLCLLSLFLFQSRQTQPSARSLEKNLDPTIKVSSTNLDTNLQNRQDFMLIRCSNYFLVNDIHILFAYVLHMHMLYFDQQLTCPGTYSQPSDRL